MNVVPGTASIEILAPTLQLSWLTGTLPESLIPYPSQFFKSLKTMF